MSQALVANLEVFAAVASTGLAAILAVVAFLSWRRIGHRRPLWIALAFAVFFIKGVLLIVLAEQNRGAEPWILWLALLDLAVLIFLYLAIKVR